MISLQFGRCDSERLRKSASWVFGLFGDGCVVVMTVTNSWSSKSEVFDPSRFDQHLHPGTVKNSVVRKKNLAKIWPNLE